MNWHDARRRGHGPRRRAEGRSSTACATRCQRAHWFTIAPVWAYDAATAERTLAQIAPQLAVTATNATVRVTGGQAEAVPAADGRELDAAATLAALAADPARVLMDGQLALVARPVPAAVQDVSTPWPGQPPAEPHRHAGGI
jgi:hypothetical protein